MAFVSHPCSVRMVIAMQTAHLPKASPAVPERPERGPFEGELMDLYVAILIVVPLALFLKSLWS